MIVGLGDAEIIDQVYALSTPEQFVLDLVGLKEPERISGDLKGICW